MFITYEAINLLQLLRSYEAQSSFLCQELPHFKTRNMASTQQIKQHRVDVKMGIIRMQLILPATNKDIIGQFFFFSIKINGNRNYIKIPSNMLSCKLKMTC